MARGNSTGGSVMRRQWNGRILEVYTDVNEVASIWRRTLEKDSSLKLEGFYRNGNDATKTCFDKETGENNWRGSLKETKDAIINGTFDSSEFSSGKIAKQCKELGKVNIHIPRKRVRSTSEHDGEFDFDRCWDLKPFYNTRRDSIPDTIDVYVEFSISGSNSATAVKNYGIAAFNTVKAIEASGYRCNVWIRTSLASPFSNGGGRAVFYIKVKSADEYLTATRFSKFFTVWFYRRCIFNLWNYTIGQLENKGVSWGFGPVWLREDKAEPGRIELTPHIAGYSVDVKKIKGLIEKAVFK